MNAKHVLVVLAAGVLSACGGGGDGANPGGSDTSAPGGLYVGYYQEDAANNPEDPMPGSYYMQLPQGNATFAGEMSFTYIGCLNTNVGTVSGTKRDLALEGNWTGTVDGTPVGGTYTGQYDAAQLRYSGTYRNAAGKVHITGCDDFEYDVAALGTWEMFPVEARSPATFVVTVSGGQLNWADVNGVSRWLASVYDVARTQSGGNAVVWQNAIQAVGNTTVEQSVPVTSLALVSGRLYVLAITAFDANNQRIGYTSTSYTAP